MVLSKIQKTIKGWLGLVDFSKDFISFLHSLLLTSSFSPLFFGCRFIDFSSICLRRGSSDTLIERLKADFSELNISRYIDCM